MNKLYKTAYMFFIWAVITLCGCAETGDARMYLEAKTQDSQNDPRFEEPSALEKDSEKDSGTGADDRQLPTGRDTSSQESKSEEEQTCFVYVCGAVRHPGVFELPLGSRVYEALAQAGGLRKDAYGKDINQAEQIEDGQMIEALTKKEYLESQEQKKTDEKAKEPNQKPDQQQDGRIDLNTATMEQLMTLSGIGEAKAANIIAYRESCGGFSAPHEIMNVSGIGEGVYARIQDKITVIQ